MAGREKWVSSIPLMFGAGPRLGCGYPQSLEQITEPPGLLESLSILAAIFIQDTESKLSACQAEVRSTTLRESVTPNDLNIKT